MENLLGGTEETTTGVNRLHGLDKAGQLKLPMIAANDSYCKYLFDKPLRHGPVDMGRHHAHDQPDRRRQESRRRRLRLVR